MAVVWDNSMASPKQRKYDAPDAESEDSIDPSETERSPRKQEESNEREDGIPDLEGEDEVSDLEEAENAEHSGYAKKVADWVYAHPWQTAFQVGMGVMMVTPGAVVAPVLSAAGFQSTLVGGSAAAAWQANITPVAARGLFATLQSAGAGGYGIPIVHGAVRAGSFVAGSLPAVAATFRRKKKPPANDTAVVELGDCSDSDDLNQKNEQEDKGRDTEQAEHAEQVRGVVRSSEELSSLLLLSSTNRTPLLTLWTASWCSSCRTIRPLLLSLIENDSVGEEEGGVGYAEVEIDSPNIGPLASQYFVNSIPTLLSFRAQEAVLEEKITSVDEMRDREFMRLWIENEARRGGERGGGGGMSTGFIGGLFGMGEKR
ncbi:MAG: hypothetical protein Q9201_007465 [Fulgogasparrea decipioides]